MRVTLNDGEEYIFGFSYKVLPFPVKMTNAVIQKLDHAREAGALHKVGYTFDKETGKIFIFHRVVQCFIRKCTNEKDSVLICEAEAVCSFLDNFSKDEGRKLALARALNGTEFNPNERGLFWNAYHSRKPDPFEVWFENYIEKNHPNGFPVSFNDMGRTWDIKELMQQAFDAGRRY